MHCYNLLNALKRGGYPDESDWNAIFNQFQKAAEDLGSLITHVASFVDWWEDMNISLQYIEKTLPFITTDGSNPFRTNAVKEHWLTVKKKYTGYNSEVCPLCRLLPIVLGSPEYL